MSRQLFPGHSQIFMTSGRAVYSGPIQYLEAHVYGANVLHVGIYRSFRIRVGSGRWRECRCALVPAGVEHALDMAGGVHGKLLVEKHGADAVPFRRRFPHEEGRVRLLDDAELLECFRWIHEEDPQLEQVQQRISRLLQLDGSEAPLSDPRILRVIELMSREPDRNFSQEEMAREIGLSPSRFLHLFREQTGLAYRRFRLWKRLMLAFKHLHETDNLTRAALDAGFADATHFSHSFRGTFGVNPAPVFRYVERFELR